MTGNNGSFNASFGEVHVVELNPDDYDDVKARVTDLETDVDALEEKHTLTITFTNGDDVSDLFSLLKQRLKEIAPSGEKRLCVIHNFGTDTEYTFYGTLSKQHNSNNGYYRGCFRGVDMVNGYSIHIGTNSVGNFTVIKWENPPMVPGVEYCTTEKWNGQDVYTMAIDFEALPNAKTKYKYFDQTMSEVISIDGIVKKLYSNGKTMSRNIHHLSGIENVWVCTQDEGDRYLAIKTTEDLTDHTAKAVIKYIK